MEQTPPDVLSVVHPDVSYADGADVTPRVTVFVCTTCRIAGSDAPQPEGAQLADAVRAACSDTRVEAVPVRCLSNCKRALSAAMVRTGGWSYVFGELTPDSAGDLLAGAALFATSADGLMPWRGRPDALKRGMIARVPPLFFREEAK